jgi:hypothetical protein
MKTSPALLILFVCAPVAPAQDSGPALFADLSIPAVAFAAGEVASSPPMRAIPQYGLEQLGQVDCSPCLAIAAGPEQVARAAKALGIAPPRFSQPQSYAIRRASPNGRTAIAALGADASGAMYGGLDLAEAVRLGTLGQMADSDHAPHIAQRGIKFNVPLDVRTPSYSDNSDAAQYNIPEMWSFDFWREFIDDMARHRYNVLSLWNLHPFPSMVKVPEYPDVALADVKRTRARLDETYSHTGRDMVRPELLADMETVRTMSIEDKIRFWRDVMQHARNRGVDVYVITWNIFVFGAEGKYGITAEQTNQKTIDYFRASVREMVLTYPLLKGMGITAGEQMSERQDEFSKEKWLWKTYGEGIRDALKQQPGRSFTLIHRFHQTGQEEIFREFRDYPGPFELSFKYSIAHMYSIPNPPYIHELLPALPPGKRTWLTVRNDDVYSFRWGDPAYARAYIRNIPGPDKIAGFYMGPDGYIWGREYLSKEPDQPRQTVMAKQWYSFLLWGRLSYEPDLPDEHLVKIVSHRFPEADGKTLFRAWAEASQVFPLITRFFWGDIDLRWFPEACLSHPRHRGYYTVRDFVEGSSMPGSNVLPILEWRRKKLAGEAMGGTTPLEIAGLLDQHGESALAALPQLRRAGMSKELRLTLGDIEAMAHLGRYYAAKIRAAASLGLYDRTGAEADQAEAIRQAEKALEAWQAYSGVYTSQYMQPRLYNRTGFVDLPQLISRARDDIEIARRWRPGTFPQDTPRPNASDRPFRK